MTPQRRNVIIRAHEIRAIASGDSFVSACKRLGVARSTVSRWQSDPRFEEDLSQAQKALADDPALQPILQRLERLEQQLQRHGMQIRANL